MKKSGILNSHIAKIAADLGHTDTICVSDCGLPINDINKKIDLAIDFGKPSIVEVLNMLNNNLEVEEVTIAEEIKSNNYSLYKWLLNEYKNIKINFVSHEELKKLTLNCKVIIRTGENTPYANVILHSGVVFERRI